MKKVIFILILCLFLNIVIAVESLPPVKQGECLNLTQICADCSYVNFTSVYNPVHQRVFSNTEATKDDSLFYVEFCNTSLIGSYIVNGIGDIEGIDTVFSYDFEVTESGNELKSIMGSIYLFIIIYAIGLIWASTNFKLFKYEEDNLNAKKAFFWVSMLHILTLIFIAWFDYMGYIGTAGTLVTLAIINGGMILYLIFVWFAEMMIDPIDYAIDAVFKNER